MTPVWWNPEANSWVASRRRRGGEGGVAAGYCLKLFTDADGTLEARVPKADTVATECTGAADEKWFMDSRGTVHNGAHPWLCLTSSNPGRLAACDSSNGAQQWTYRSDGHLTSAASPTRSLDLNRATRLPILYNTSTGSDQKWIGLSATPVLATDLLNSVSIKKLGELGL